MSRPLHPSLARIYNRAPDDASVLLIDETYAFPNEGYTDTFYALTGSLIEVRLLEGTRRNLTEVAGAKYWHTTEQMRTKAGRKKTLEMIKLCADFADPQYISVYERIEQSDNKEHVRQDCIATLLAQAISTGANIHGFIFEARHLQSANDKDRNSLKRLRASNKIPRQTHSAWVSPSDEPCLWIPDLVGYAFRRSRTHTDETQLWFGDHLAPHCTITHARKK